MRQGLQPAQHRLGQLAGDGREIDDRGGHHAPTGNDVGPEDRQVIPGIGEEDAVQDLQAGTEAGGLEVELAQATAAAQLIADEEILTIEAAADRLQVRIHRQGCELRQVLPAAADALGQGVHQRMDAKGDGAHGRCGDSALILPAECGKDTPTPACRPRHGLPRPAASPLPEPQRQQLSNGVPLVQLDLPDAPLVCLDLWCQAGSAGETAAESGMAHFLEHMVFKGSAQLPAGEFDRRIEALGGSSNAATGFDDVHFHVLIPGGGGAGPGAAAGSCAATPARWR